MRQQIGILFGFLTVAFTLALIRGVTAAQTTAGRVAVAAICGVLVLAAIAAWVVCSRRRGRLEVTADVIRYVSRNGQPSALSRQQGDELRFVQRHRGGRIWTLELSIVGTDAAIVLSGFFSRDAVRQACRARGWRFD